jgi:GNAT superfamily N-acetyltransferase
MDLISMEILSDVAALKPLADDAQADGRRMVSRLIQEWKDQLYCAVRAGHICGVCGLNLDPFANEPAVGRVRRLYVAYAFRRKGVGSAIMNRLLADARKHFRALHLRTFDPGACGFYESIGFSKVEGDANCTHRLDLVMMA